MQTPSIIVDGVTYDRVRTGTHEARALDPQPQRHQTNMSARRAPTQHAVQAYLTDHGCSDGVTARIIAPNIDRTAHVVFLAMQQLMERGIAERCGWTSLPQGGRHGLYRLVRDVGRRR